MTMIHQEICSVLFRCDRIIVAFPYHFDAGYEQFVSKLRTGVFLDDPFDDQRSFLRQRFCDVEQFLTYIIFQNDALEIMGAVTQLQKSDFSAASFVGYPSTNGNLLPYIFFRLVHCDKCQTILPLLPQKIVYFLWVSINFLMRSTASASSSSLTV
ncbi:hypothetical protein SDC9_162226 [bioreactor metagenome]|uniref:Uncharacterized protein n=1 Tax=bioreactor metagenome TaxID=1076179 RepID=A0A645FKG1_9ZZZZ